MPTFFLDLWADLREKRLWPVAALILIAIAAVPFTLLKKEQPAPAAAAPTTTVTTASDRLPTIQLEDINDIEPSNLGQFSERNPFRSLADLPKTKSSSKKDDSQTVDLGESPDSTSSGSSSSSSSTSSGSSNGSSTGGSSSSSSGSGSSGSTRTIYYDYRADVKFGLAGQAKAIKQVAAFTLLGDKDEPAALFMGVTDDHRWAVFSVDTAHYQAEGEHECKPTPERCEFVYLKVADDANETTLTSTDGTKSYDLELTAIKRIVLDKDKVENVPTEDESDDSASSKRNTVDPEPRSWFDLLAKRF